MARPARDPRNIFPERAVNSTDDLVVGNYPLPPQKEDKVANAKFVFPNDQPIVKLDCEEAFDSLALSEQFYAHHLSRASWTGSLIVLLQTSPESPHIYVVLRHTFLHQSIEELKERVFDFDRTFTESDFQAFVVYAAAFFTNMGNYRGFGDDKFVPNMTKAKFSSVLLASKGWKAVRDIWTESLSDLVFSLDPIYQHLNFPEKGVTTYFSSNCTENDLKLVSNFIRSKDLEAYNQRLMKLVDKQGNVTYKIRLASVTFADNSESVYNGIKYCIEGNDYSAILKKVNEELEKAGAYGSDVEKKILKNFYTSFQSGSLAAHREGSRNWVENKEPIVENYIGFIETYRDPSGQRGEFEGFVAVVNKSQSQKYLKLVASAKQFIALLPWSKEFEKDEFCMPDFSSLDVLTFAGSAIPIGINIPNYDDIRQNHGFKNVVLGNVVPASTCDIAPPFLSISDQDLLNRFRIPAYEVQVGLHELLGHGSGKLLNCTNGKHNFDVNVVKLPGSGNKVTTWYKDGETYSSVFADLSSAYEECRAECVGLYLSLNDDVLRIFNMEGEGAENVKYVNWLSLLYNGAIKALEMYDPPTQKWFQAHSQARFAIVSMLLEAGEGLLEIKEVDDGADLLLCLDQSKIETVGKPALKLFLEKLNVFKATANVEAARTFFTRYTMIPSVPEEGQLPWLKWRDIIVAKKMPRKMFVQPNTTIDEAEKVILHVYSPTPEGIIQSWMERFPNQQLDEILMELAKADQHHFFKTKHGF